MKKKIKTTVKTNAVLEVDLENNHFVGVPGKSRWNGSYEGCIIALSHTFATAVGDEKLDFEARVHLCNLFRDVIQTIDDTGKNEVIRALRLAICDID